MSTQIKHKHALYEIFEAKMATGQSLYGNCDRILKTNVTKLSGKEDKFICLSDFVTTSVDSGRIKDKYFVVVQDIICGGVDYEREADGEVNAEYWAYTLVKLVRTILKDNQTLVSTSYPTGVAFRSFLRETMQEFVLYHDIQCCIHTLPLEIHVTEDNS